MPAAPPAPMREFHTLKSISLLTDVEVREEFTKAEMIHLIRGVEYPFAGKERLENFDLDTLQRVVFLVRRWSQNKLGTFSL